MTVIINQCRTLIHNMQLLLTSFVSPCAEPREESLLSQLKSGSVHADFNSYWCSILIHLIHIAGAAASAPGALPCCGHL